ncbi:HTH-type transcriptional regulator PgrR [Burkholderia multivorans]|uniref:LysR family transcriptional regulator n=1 Tax=Burkholderia multivorans TaxID=87883 RepID=UPI00018E370E|nr:LysR family transcriptional regulator [Burkholderia multivorans]EED96940.1 LysR substrate binding domain protein [Burkholderia multivorans CGD1]MDR8751501.1 HTH-type transcriptional regulator PgrR [Burkholderia multivorans]MDR8810548.1 HTH-type transcriptional regulator PgrR [Burkholderia multivorans]
MDKLQAMQVFTRVVETKSFTGAAASLDMTRSSATTIVQNLEAHLKVRLLNRTTRNISLTPDGAAYYERCLRVLADIADAESSFSSIAAPKGKLKVDMSGAIGRLVVVPALHEFHSRYPDIDLMLGVGDKDVDLVQDSVDCAIRMGPLADSTLVARRIGVSDFVTVASPEYLARYGIPRTIEDLDNHTAVNYFSSRTGRMVEIDFVVDGKPIDVKMRSRLAANDGEAYLQCGLRGHGLIQTPHFLALPHLKSGALVEVLEQWRPTPFPISAVYPRNRHLSPQVRVFVEWISELFEQCHLLRSEDLHPALLAQYTAGSARTDASIRFDVEASTSAINSRELLTGAHLDA